MCRVAAAKLNKFSVRFGKLTLVLRSFKAFSYAEGRRTRPQRRLDLRGEIRICEAMVEGVAAALREGEFMLGC